MSAFRLAWEDLEKAGTPLPTRVRKVNVLEWATIAAVVPHSGSAFARHLVGSLYAGDVWVLKRCFPEDFMRSLKDRAAAWWTQSPSSFSKMLEGCKDFHRVIDFETGKKYAFRACRHQSAFYRWNDDPLGLWPTVTERWRIVKQLSGYEPDIYEKNTPKDGVIDRVQVVRYPPRIGYLEPHQDPYPNYRVNVSAYMNTRGVDYEGGGFYCVDKDDKLVDMEQYLGIGDATIACPPVCHGIAPCDVDKTPDWDGTDGRWALLMYCADSDEKPSRVTGNPVRGLNLPGAMPQGVT